MARLGVKVVCITKDEYDKLKKDSELLARLEAAGVDNWEGYSEAFDEERR